MAWARVGGGRDGRAELLMAAHRWNDLQGIALAKRGHRAQAEAVIANMSTLEGQNADAARCWTVSTGRCGDSHLAHIAAALGDDARAVSLLPPGFGTTGTAHRAVA